MSFSFKNFNLPLGKKTYIMGILNITPDSFSDGGKYVDANDAVAHALQMEKLGADIIDIGAQSTRPGHIEISAEEEWLRLSRVLPELKSKLHCPISVDTYYPLVAQTALDNGAHIINDVSGRFQDDMADIVKRCGAGWILMHTGGGNADTEVQTNDIVSDVQSFFSHCLDSAEKKGIKRNSICLDMGIGFGKTYNQNLTLLRETANLKVADVALLAGISRKRVVGTATGVASPEKRIYGNISAHSCVIGGGADILRVHDVGAEKQGAMMADAIFRTGKSNG